MEVPEKLIQTHVFTEGQDSDTAPDLMPNTRARSMMNCRAFTDGEKGVITNIKGNVLIDVDLPAGVNTTVGWVPDEESGRFLWFVKNSNNYHTIFIYDYLSNTVIRLLQSRTDSNNVDILRLSGLILHADIVQNNLLTWVDGVQKARKTNIAKLLDKSSAGYGLTVTEDLITAYKMTSVYAPTGTYFTDVSRNTNSLYGKLFKFCQRFGFIDGEKSNWSDWSTVPLPPNQSYLGVNSITTDNNGIRLQVATGSQEVQTIEIAVKVNSLLFELTATLNKAELGIGDNSTYIYNFYNDNANVGTDNGKVNRPYSYLPRVPRLQAFVKNAMIYGAAVEGFAPVKINVSIEVQQADIYLPPGTVNKLNNPLFTATEVSTQQEKGFLNKGRTNVTAKFLIGNDVKKGNVFSLYGNNGGSDHYSFTYTASVVDTASSVANVIKTYLRNIGRGIPDATNGITAESLDPSGNVTFTYSYLGEWRENKVVWTTNVTPVSVQSLQDSGTSLQIIKPGSDRKYAILYEDDDGRKSLGYTSDACSVKTPFITEVGGIKATTHSIKIYHQPPDWARWYQILRTADNTSFIQLLIQKVIDVTTTSDVEYLDLVVGSLFTYQKLHPNTILTYEFERGDRLRLIKDENAGTLYTPYFETEVLSYSVNTVEDINSNMTLKGTDLVTPDDPIRPDYVGKSIIINGIEREITAVAGNQYKLSSIISLGSADTPAIYPNYQFVDRRGIIRIKKPVGITINDLSTIELYKPIKNAEDSDYKIFYDFGQKYEILNYGSAQRAHAGSAQNQDGSTPASLAATPAIVKIGSGDAYIRYRELPTNNVVPGTQVLVDSIVDPNFSDFYESNLHDTGRPYPQDDNSGVKFFGSRLRYSNNYIEDTRINGLNDFDALDRGDYNDPYGDIMLIRYRDNRLYSYKRLKSAWIGIQQRTITTADGQSSLTASDKLLNDMIYYAWEGGIGDNPESWVSLDNYQYIASANSGVFLRIAGDGCDPISQQFNYDKEARRILAAVAKYKLNIFGGADREFNEVLWAVPAYGEFLYDGSFIDAQYKTTDDLLPDGVTFEIVQQPAHAQALVNPDGTFAISGTNTLGDDFLLYRPLFPDGTTGDVKKYCFTVVASPDATPQWRVKQNTSYCQQEKAYFRPKDGTQYCQQEPADIVVTDPFDYMVIRLIWPPESGTDLDIGVGYENTGTQYDNDYVGYGQGDPKVPAGAAHPYLYWASDNLQSGVEAVLVDEKQFVADNPGVANVIDTLIAAVWYNNRLTGDTQVQLQTYLGGTMSLDQASYNFVNTGGQAVDTITLNKNVTAANKTVNVASYTPVAIVSYDKTTQKATITLQ
jgi:hypothetical protein